MLSKNTLKEMPIDLFKEKIVKNLLQILFWILK